MWERLLRRESEEGRSGDVALAIGVGSGVLLVEALFLWRGSRFCSTEDL